MSSLSCHKPMPSPPSVSNTIRVQLSHSFIRATLNIDQVHTPHQQVQTPSYSDLCPSIIIASWHHVHAPCKTWQSPRKPQIEPAASHHFHTLIIWAVPLCPQPCVVTVPPLPISDAFLLAVVDAVASGQPLQSL